MTLAPAPAGLRRMVSRDRHEPHRVASSLELLFDLVFVVAVSQASQNLHHLISEGRIGQGVLAYLMVFFAVWWAWMNFTWFASAFDTDDWLYRVMTIVQMGGVLVLAAGIHEAMDEYDYTIVTWGYVIMRLAMVGQWLRAGMSDAASRRTAFTFAAGIVVVQVLWVARIYLLDPTGQFITFFILVAAEVSIAPVAERQGTTSWHARHISERYRLVTLILLGESILAAATAVIEALGDGEHVPELIGMSASALVIAAGMWWIYFAREQAENLDGARRGFQFGYLHYVIFAAAGAVSAGIEVEIDRITGTTDISAETAGFALTLPVGLFVITAWAVLMRRLVARWASAAILGLGTLIIVSAVLPVLTVAATAVLIVAIVVVLQVDGSRPSVHRRSS